MDWSPDIRAFFDSSQAVRGNQMMPTSEAFLDAAPARYMPNCYMVEITDDQAVVRFQGSFLMVYWQSYYTGLEMHGGNRSKYKAHSLGNMQTIVRHPCGQHLLFHFDTSLGIQAVAEHINLPLAVKPGRPPRMICLIWPTESHKPLERLERVVRSIARDETAWIDIGAGVPAKPPLRYA